MCVRKLRSWFLGLLSDYAADMVIWSSDESAVVGSLVVAGSLEFGPLAPNVTVLAFVSVNQFNFQ